MPIQFYFLQGKTSQTMNFEIFTSINLKYSYERAPKQKIKNKTKLISKITIEFKFLT